MAIRFSNVNVTMVHDKGSLGRKTGGKCWILVWFEEKLERNYRQKRQRKRDKG